MTDIFDVESEIAKRVAGSLQAKLTGREEQALAVKPTNNPEAYDAYLRGLAFEARNLPFHLGRPEVFMSMRCSSILILRWPGRGSLARTRFSTLAATTTHGPLAARAEAAKRALEKAQRLEPDSPETLLAMGYYQYRVLRDSGAAKTTFGRVNKMLPGNSEAPYALGRVARLEGHFDQEHCLLGASSHAGPS